jgi:hypothetical protein
MELSKSSKYLRFLSFLTHQEMQIGTITGQRYNHCLHLISALQHNDCLHLIYNCNKLRIVTCRALRELSSFEERIKILPTGHKCKSMAKLEYSSQRRYIFKAIKQLHQLGRKSNKGIANHCRSKKYLQRKISN